MKNQLEEMFMRYGTVVTLCHGQEEAQTRGFFQPFLSRGVQYMERMVAPLGENPRGQYCYIGPAQPRGFEGDTLLVGDKAYILRRAELIMEKDTPLYCWGLCVEKGGEDTWGDLL